jgi:2'-5' RNA ligase
VFQEDRVESGLCEENFATDNQKSVRDDTVAIECNEMLRDMRVFVAINLPDDVRRELGPLQNALAIGRLVPAENLHLTLSFLGDQNEVAVEDAHEALDTMRARAFNVQLAGVGSFGHRSPQVIFADVARCPELLELEQRITRSLRHAGLEFQKRRFRPHVTLARMPKTLSAFELARVRDYLAEHAAFHGTVFKVTRFRLYQSTLTPGGALHDTLASYPLADV